MRGEITRMSTVFCEMMDCVHNGSGVCDAESIAVIQGKCAKKKKKKPEEKQNKPGGARRIKLFEGTEWI